MVYSSGMKFKGNMNKQLLNKLVNHQVGLIEEKKEPNPNRNSGSPLERDEQGKMNPGFVLQKMEEEYSLFSSTTEKYQLRSNFEKQHTFKGKMIDALTTGHLQNENREKDMYSTKQRMLNYRCKQLYKERQIDLASSFALMRFLNNMFCADHIGKIILLIVVCSSQGVKGDTYSCPVSSKTIQRVDSCPQNKAEWDVAAMKKRCEDIQQNCILKEKFQYHCVLSSDGKSLVEVCAPEKFIIDGYCAGYDDIGFMVIEMYTIKCKCPPYYSSTSAFEHQECYSLIEQRNNSSGNKTVHNRTCLTSEGTECIPLPEEKRQNVDSNENDKIIIICIFFLLFGTSAIVFVVFLTLCLRKRIKFCKDMNGKGRMKEGDDAKTMELLAPKP